MVTIPNINDPDLKKLINNINPKLTPIKVPVIPEEGTEINECINAVKLKIAKEGGEQLFGWQIWKGKILIEAEFHSIWESPKNELISVTPAFIPNPLVGYLPVNCILFIEDKNLNYEGKQMDSIRLNITNNEVVDDFIEACTAEFKFNNKGSRALMYGISLDPNTVEGKNYIQLINYKQNLEQMAIRGLDINTPCFCGSKKEYKNCCRNKIIKFFKTI